MTALESAMLRGTIPIRTGGRQGCQNQEDAAILLTTVRHREIVGDFAKSALYRCKGCLKRAYDSRESASEATFNYAGTNKTSNRNEFCIKDSSGGSIPGYEVRYDERVKIGTA